MSENKVDVWKKQAEDNLKSMDTNREKVTRVGPGKTKVRILPSWHGEGDLRWFHKFGVHYIHGMTPDAQGNTLKAVYMCTQHTFDSPCPICEAIQLGIMSSSDDAVLKKLDDAKANNVYLVNALILSGSDPKTPVVLELKKTVYKAIEELIQEHGNITDLSEGLDLIINKEGKGINTKYSVIAAAKSVKIPAKLIADRANLDEYVAQEYEEGKIKALSALREVAGKALSGTTTSGTKLLSNDLEDADALSSVLEDDGVIEADAVVEAAVAEDDIDLDDILADLG